MIMGVPRWLSGKHHMIPNEDVAVAVSAGGVAGVPSPGQHTSHTGHASRKQCQRSGVRCSLSATVTWPGVW